MTQFIELLINGISLGFVYALVALGFVVIFKSSRVVNFAHGSIVLFGAFVIAKLADDLGFLLAVLVGVVLTGVLAALVYNFVLRHVRGRAADTVTIATIGVDIILATELGRQIGQEVLNIGDPWTDKVVHFGEFSVPEARVAAAVVALVLLGAFLAAFKYSPWGVAMRAAAEDGEAAALMGIRLRRVAVGAWLVAGGLAAVGAVFLSTFPTPGVDRTSGLVALSAFPAAILGGLDSVLGAIVGGLVIGVVVTMSAGYQDEIAFLGRGLGQVAPYVVMVAVLLVRPSGLFGTRELTRV
ncbi:MAG TPA: branched-chain amino acid ABC transporter permease [Solirubrobacteraceae bacterium]